jgi:hypothetical protein
MWIPLVLVGSVLYWTLAMNLGGLSMSLFGCTNEEELALQPAAVTEEPIVVRLQSWSEVRGAGGFQTADDGTGRLPASDEATPPPPEDPIGRTSY